MVHYLLGVSSRGSTSNQPDGCSLVISIDLEEIHVKMQYVMLKSNNGEKSKTSYDNYYCVSGGQPSGTCEIACYPTTYVCNKTMPSWTV